MAGNAGSVAPVFHAEGYVATNIYDFYHAIIHNNKLYFCRQDGTIGHEPSGATDEYWFLSLDGNFGDAAKLGGESATQWQTKIDVEKARIDALIALEESSEPTDVEKEVNDIKVGADGVTYGSAGTAVREQIASVKSDLSNEVLNRNIAIADEKIEREQAILSAVTTEKERAVARENEIEGLFTAPTEEAVTKWLDEHPEATTTVQDGSLEVAKFTEDAKLHILKDYVTPQMFGAKGDSHTDDTEAFYRALSETDNLYLPEGTYLIDFQCINLTGKTIRGASASSTRIMQRNSNVPFAQIGVGTEITNLTIHMRQNTERTACLLFGYMNGTKVEFTNHLIENVNFLCDSHTVVLHYALYGGGCVGGVVRDIEVNTCGIGIWVDMTTIGWLTAHTVENVNIYRAHLAGIKITDADNKGQHTQSQYCNISVMNYIDGAIGFDIGNCGVAFVNPVCFIENGEGTTYSIKIDKSLALKQKTAPYNVPLFVGGMLEGLVINKDYLNLAKFENTLFLPYKNLKDTVITYPSLNSTIRPITRDVVEEYESNTSGISNVNATITHGTDEFGAYIEFSRTDETQKASFVFNAGSNDVLGSEVTSYPVSTFFSVVGINFATSYLTQIYDTGLGNTTDFITLPTRIDVPVSNKTFLCYRTLIDNWAQHEQYKVHNMQLTLSADAPTGSKVRIYKYRVNYGITPSAKHL